METLTFVRRDTTDREGEALVTKDGRPYTRMTIKVASKGDRYISGFGNPANNGWAVGDEVDITITESDKKDGKGQPYLNFTMPKREDKVDQKLEQILNKLTGLSLDLMRIEVKLNGKKSSYPEESNETAFDSELDDSTPF